MRTITLELLRHGPANNQLLSPLTPYLAICENHGAVTMHMPFEHNQFLHRLDALSYKVSEEARQFQLKDTAAVMRELLASIPGLTAETNKKNDGLDALTHLRLVLSASELALLPFELALSPDGVPGSGQHLLLQPQAPICITRESRRVPDANSGWSTRRPRILFAAAAPDGVSSIPVDAHLLCLRAAIDPWVRYFDPDNTDARRAEVDRHLVFMPNASVGSIEEACATGNFTHVHILAHGVERVEGYDKRFFLALHKSRTSPEIDYVDGVRLAGAVRPVSRSVPYGLARPNLVSLASCNSGNGGSVAGAGGSLAHALHEAGVEMVVAGQFPFSFPGSVRLVEILFEGLLWGADPRHVVYDLRRRLFGQFPSKHDWASLVTYLSVPEQFDRENSECRINQASKSFNVALEYADEWILRKSTKKLRRSRDAKLQRAESSNSELEDNARRRIALAKSKLQELLIAFPSEAARIHELLGSAGKREAEIQFKNFNRDECLKLLAGARDHYWSAFGKNATQHWALVQYISIDLLLRSVSSDKDIVGFNTQDCRKLWSCAHAMASSRISSHITTERCWAINSLVELHLLATLPDLSGTSSSNEASGYIDRLMETADQKSFEVYALRRQLVRYPEWYVELNSNWSGLASIAETLVQKLPEELDVDVRW